MDAMPFELNIEKRKQSFSAFQFQVKAHIKEKGQRSLSENLPEYFEYTQHGQAHELADEAIREVKKLAETYGLKFDLTSAGYETMNAWLHPYTIGKTREEKLERLIAAGFYYYLLFFIDDTLTSNSANTLDAEKSVAMKGKMAKMLKGLPHINLKNLDLDSHSGKDRTEDLGIEEAIFECFRRFGEIANNDYQNFAQQLTEHCYSAQIGLLNKSAITIEKPICSFEELYKNNFESLDIYVAVPESEYVIDIAEILNSGDPDGVALISQLVGSATWLNRFKNATMQHLTTALSHETEPLTSEKFPTLQEFLSNRIHDSGMHPTWRISEICYGSYIDPEFFSTYYNEFFHSIVDTQRLAILICALFNDLCSVSKESLDTASAFNIIPFLYISKSLVDCIEPKIDDVINKAELLIKNFFNEYTIIVDSMQKKINQNSSKFLKNILMNFLKSIKDAHEATVLWEVNETDRYMHFISIYEELLKMAS